MVDFGIAYERAILDWIDHLDALPGTTRAVVISDPAEDIVDIPPTTPHQP